MSRAMDLARLAADERTPIHEREAAALALAKIVARDGLGPSSPSDHESTKAVARQRHDIARFRSRIASLEIQLAQKQRTIDAMETIAKQTQEELRELRENSRPQNRRHAT